MFQTGMTGERIADLRRSYSFMAERGIQEYSFGDFVNILKVPEPLCLNGPDEDTYNSNSELIVLNRTIVTNNSKELTPIQEQVIDFAGLFIHPTFKDGKLQAVVVTVSSEIKIVPIELLDPWLETVNRNTAFFNRELYLNEFFQSAKSIQLVKILHWKDNLWRLGVQFSSGLRIRETLIESKLHGGLPAPN